MLYKKIHDIISFEIRSAQTDEMVKSWMRYILKQVDILILQSEKGQISSAEIANIFQNIDLAISLIDYTNRDQARKMDNAIEVLIHEYPRNNMVEILQDFDKTGSNKNPLFGKKMHNTLSLQKY